MSAWESLKNFVLTTLGHAVSGGIIAAAYEVTELIQGGVNDWKIIGMGLILGGLIGFFRTVVEELEGIGKDTKGRKKIKSWGRYFI